MGGICDPARNRRTVTHYAAPLVSLLCGPEGQNKIDSDTNIFI